MKLKTYKCVFNLDDPNLGNVSKTYYISAYKKPSDIIINKIEDELEEGLLVHKVYLDNIKSETELSDFNDFEISQDESSYIINCDLPYK